MNQIQAKPMVYEGINFRSKLEARWYFFMKNLGWNIEYEPDIEGIVGWIPDFLILGKGTKVLLEVKPFQTLSDFEGDYAPPLGMVLAGLSVESYGIKATYIVLAGVLSVTSILVLLTKALRSNF